ncbi:MAG: T9SS type A sorting domain-containing protein [Bacteroidota bacterium]
MRKQFTLLQILRTCMMLMTIGIATVANAQTDAGVSAIVSPSNLACQGTQPVTAVIQNYGAAGITSALVNWSVNGIAQAPFNYNGLLFTGETDTVTIGNYAFSFGSNILDVRTASPNGGADADSSNDSTAITVVTQMNGSYTIGGTTPDFAKFNDAVSALSTHGICGPVIFNMRAGTDTMQSLIQEIVGADSVNTITFQSENGDSTSVLLTYPSVDSLNPTNYLISLDGADYITFKQLSLERSGILSYGRVLELMNNATHITVTNCRLMGSTNATNNSLAALIYSGATSPTNDSSMVITNNRFINGSIGVYMNGINTIQLELDNVVADNVFQNQYSKGIQASNIGVVNINRNQFTTSSNNIAYAGIYLDRSQRNHQITKNKMTSIPGTGIYMVDCTGLAGIHGVVANNFILCTDSAGLSMNNGDYQDIVHNTIVMRGSNPTYSALFARGNGTGKTVRNNILNNTGGGYAYVVSDSAVTGITISNYNNLFVTGTNVGVYDGVVTTSLNDWISASEKDSNSVQVNPNFVTPTDLHATSIAMEDLGKKLANVNDDIDGEIRSANAPDIGADEYSAAQRNVGVQALLSPVDSTCGDTLTPVTVVVTNTGSLQENNFDVTTIFSGVTDDTLTFTITTPILPGESDTITYSGTIDLTAGGTLNVISYTSLGVDDVHANDTLTASYTIGVPPAGPVAIDISRCGPGAVTLTATSSDSLIWYDAPVGGTYLASGASYTTNSLNSSTLFYVAAYGFCEGVRTSVQAVINPIPVVTLGNDTSILDGDNIDFDAGTGFTSYIWSNGASTQTINVNTAGCYSVTVTNSFGCSNTDEVCLTVILPFDAGVTAILNPIDQDCASATTDVSVVVSNLGSSAASNIPVDVTITGSLTTSFSDTVVGPLNPGDSVVLLIGTINTATGGTYTITGYTSYGSDQNTSNDTTTSTLDINVSPGAPAGVGTSRCGEGSVILNASGTNTIAWYDAPTGGNLLFIGDTYSIPNLSTTTIFYAQDGNICNTQPRAAVTATVNALPNVNLGNDTTVTDSLILDAGAGFVQYLWNTSETTQTIEVDSSGTIIVAVIDGNGCINSDTIDVTIIVGLTENQIANGMMIYPNPTASKLNINLGKTANAIITLTDMQGQILMTDKVNNASDSVRTYDVTTYAKGIYFLNITSGEQTSTSKVIVH